MRCDGQRMRLTNTGNGMKNGMWGPYTKARP